MNYVITDELSPEFIDSMKSTLKAQNLSSDTTVADIAGILYSNLGSPVLWDVLPGHN